MTSILIELKRNVMMNQSDIFRWKVKVGKKEPLLSNTSMQQTAVIC